LEAVRTVPFTVGKTGLVRLLVGSAESSIRADRSPSYGVLGDVVKARVDNLIDRLIEDGFLFRDMNHDYKIITLTDRGRAATEDDLASYQQVATASTSRGGSRSAGGSMDEAQPLDEEGEAVYGRLTAWRAERAAADGMPAYVIAHNSMLHDLALIRPRTMGDLAEVSGFGGKRIEKYGDEVLAIINGG
jgi:ATP-dependent DNA helicase RecQ